MTNSRRSISVNLLYVCAALTLMGAWIAQSEEWSSAKTYCVDPEKSHFQILVDSGGLFGFFAHDHVVEAKQIRGCAEIDAENSKRASVWLEFPAAAIIVLDPKSSRDERGKVQKQMEEQVLRIREFPTIRFESTGVDGFRSILPGSLGEQKLTVEGKLTIRDRTQPVAVPLTVQQSDTRTLRVSGEYSFRQTSFGIKPIRIAAGTVRVKDELRIRFEIFLAATTEPPP